MKRFMVLLGAATMLAGPASAQDYPNRPITFVVPFATGGGNDALARIVTAQVANEIGGVFVVENRPGGGGGVAAQYVIQAGDDGYTLLQGNIAHAINMSFYDDPGYDLEADLAPVTLLATSALLICVHPDLPVETLQDLIELAREQPGALTYGSSGIGGSSHLAVELLMARAGIEMLHIPYQGSAPSVTDLVAGRLDVALPVMSNAPGLIEAGQVKCLASTGAERSALAPDVPTVAEAGIEGYEAAPWYGVMAPAGTDPEIVSRLAESFNQAVANPQVAQQLVQLGFDVVGTTPEDFGAYIADEIEKWREVVELSGATPEG